MFVPCQYVVKVVLEPILFFSFVLDGPTISLDTMYIRYDTPPAASTVGREAALGRLLLIMVIST